MNTENYYLLIIININKIKILFILFYFIFIIFILCSFKKNKSYNYCSKCIQYKKINNKKCLECPLDAIFKNFKIFNEEETLNEIIINNKSIARFGDGEFLLIYGQNIGFQKFNKTLSNKLKEVLNNDYNNLLIGINLKSNKNIEKYTNFSKNYYLRWIEINKLKIASLLNKKINYYSSMITRFYIEYKDKSQVPQYIKILKKIWDRKDILIIEGENTRIGVGNNLINLLLPIILVH